ncbi:MAG TPA: hypothetical protein PKD61_38625, partial [Polyangiaceae bacterium]|nr:hypothetical protein [Polyangiaceae bacterium]
APPEQAEPSDPFAGALDDELNFDNLDLRAVAPLLESEDTPPRGTSAEKLREAVPSQPAPEEMLGLDQYDEISDAPTVVGEISELDALLASPTIPPEPPDATATPGAASDEAADSSFQEAAEVLESRPPEDLRAPDAELGTLSADEAAAILDSLPPEEAPADDADAEQPASAFLGAMGNLDVWQARAEWMENEAQARPDAASKGRGLVVASELWAMTGDLERAREVAAEAHSVLASSAVVQRQSRWLAQSGEDWKGTAALLESEARSAPDAAHRTHATYLAMEVHRLKLGDAAASQRKLDALVRAAPEDARGVVAKVAAQLAQSAGPPKIKLPAHADLAPLNEAVATLSYLRDGAATGAAPALAAAEQTRRAAA